MFSIGEFSKITGLAVRTLRFYHEEGLLVPAAVDRETGYRSYDERNIERARIIKALREMEFSLEDIAEILAGCEEDADVLGHLERQRGSLQVRLAHLRRVVEQIDAIVHTERSARETERMTKTHFEIEEKSIGPQLVAGMRMKGRYQDMGPQFGRLGKRVGRYIGGKPLCLYYDGEYREQDADFEPCFPVRKLVDVDGVSTRELPGVRAITLVHRGPYEELGRTYARLFKYVKERGYEVSTPTREVYLKGPGMIFRGNPKKFLTEIQLPIGDSK
jgi:DNA-binding transcriptional MerR regulator/effector-binding domain-containing protein